ncbi:hypothetical protein BDZ90DRAFT_234347 [Jaminaea rosea]|uniref:Uncharacterized protein n=1 Tax=Jaminaea rosea TaxID=1569628 RepID=A0A316UMI7_9BASI|nr:hypothetical protein BDZ90DRAFT_234347 [Jaminaea rosea]PWN25133.1 hypothetical protein BDZ90DRAFT_234347 [Jaminaea rosea]
MPPRRQQTQASSSTVRDPQPLNFEDEDEAVSAGNEVEDRGERAAYGSKAQRYYEEALTCYMTYARRPNCPNAAYNAARVLHILADGFYMPQKACAALLEARELYGLALTGAKSAAAQQGAQSGEMDFVIDVASNLAATLQSLGETMTNHEDLLLRNLDDARQRVVAIASEAAGHLEDVATEQDKTLASQLRDHQEPSAPATAIQDTSQASTDTSTPPNFEPQPAPESSTVYSSSLISPSSLLETLSSLHSLYLSCLLPHATNAAEVQEAAQRMTAVLSRAQDYVAAWAAAGDWGAKQSPDDDWAAALSSLQRGNDEAEVAVLRSLANLLGLNNPPSDLGSSAALAAAEEASRLGTARHTAIQALLADKTALSTAAGQLHASQRSSFWGRKVQELTEQAEQAVTLARCLLQFSFSHESGPALLRLSFQLATSASQLYLYLSSLLDTTSGTGGSAAVLGSKTDLNPSSLQRCEIFASLSEVSLLRSHQSYTTLRNPAVVNNSTRTTMQDNAKVYARKALAQVGLEWVLTEKETNASKVEQRLLVTEKRGSEVPPRGFEAIETQAQALMASARACLHRKEFRPEGAASVPQAEAAELEALAVAVRVLRQGRMLQRGAEDDESGDYISRQGWRIALDPKVWWDGLAEEESAGAGGNVRPEEERFWRSQWPKATCLAGEDGAC